ncbi:beta-lactamase [Desulfarculus baarsii DSM 2075]|uniref:Beta-lactamase n=1 Tax=Desulfarculus baarsii (strain ATCC 33931 / DSM 2075 / LMG 7858 / VKM B-1802 / 2st14) TaxID=644282 RepID=E1QDY2_DESB2|nr:MBL fold metallo-hydrolase [Desulfarculus baarsii]ADK83768.1 beta-lactamase [Desulfarculus baarsii DSM 2075]
MAVLDRSSIRSLPLGDQLLDIGQCQGLRVLCVSEVGWWDDAKVINDVVANGGLAASQWTAPWQNDNAAGACNLVEVDYPGGATRRFLLDCGWDPDYIARRLAQTGVDRMIADGQVEFLYMSHEHMDHFFGVEAVLKLRPDLPVIVPETFSQKALDFLAGRGDGGGGSRNDVAHAGPLIRLEVGMIHQLMPGCASVTFDVPIILDVRGEQSLYFLVAEKGLVAMAGCCHQGMRQFLELPGRHLNGAARLYGLYGGMHIAPFGEMAAEQEQAIDWLVEQKPCVVAANHCTGLAAIEKMREKGLPVLGGSGRDGSGSDLYTGNGDWVDF